MPGIYISAIITIVIILSLASLVIIKRLTQWDRLIAIVWMILAGLAFFGAYYLLRLPVDAAVRALMQNDPTNYRWVASLYAPLTEEPAKWIVIIPLFLIGKITSKNKGAWALSLGIGFGIGEILFLAQSVAADPLSAGLPWYYSNGFIVERLMVCIIHSGFILIAIEAILSRKYWLILLAPVLHWLLNFPIFLSIQFPFNDGGVLWGLLLWMWTTLFMTGSLILLGSRLFTTTSQKSSILGKAICPECNTLYVRPLIGINRIGRRYERCPNCKKNHWTTLYKDTSDLSKS